MAWGIAGETAGARARRLAALALAMALALAACGTPPIKNPGLRPAPAGHDWTQFGYDAARSGNNTSETALTPATAPQLVKLWQTRLPAVADSSPALLHALDFSGSARDILYVTTRDGRLLALDASDGTLLWQKQPSGPKITHSSPVTDPSRGYVYAYGLDGYVHRYDAVSGAEATGGGWPERITLMRQTEKESSALNLANGRLYVTTSGYIGDAPPYQGHIVTIDLQSGAETVFNSLCSDQRHLLQNNDCSSQQSGIWARGGAVVDPVTGNIFAVTGNGRFNANSGGVDYGDSILELSPDGGRLLDSYTPEDHGNLNTFDLDLGSMAPALLPRVANSATPLLLVQGGKDGKLRLLNRANLSGQRGPGHVGGALQTIDTGCGYYSQAAVWSDPASGQPWLAVAFTCGLTIYRLATDASGVSRLQQVWRDSVTRPTTPVYAHGVLYTAEPGALRAWDATSGKRLWSSDQRGAGGSIGGIHWQSPIVVDGAIYISDEDGALTCYGLKA